MLDVEEKNYFSKFKRLIQYFKKTRYGRQHLVSMKIVAILKWRQHFTTHDFNTNDRKFHMFAEWNR